MIKRRKMKGEHTGIKGQKNKMQHVREIGSNGMKKASRGDSKKLCTRESFLLFSR